LGAWCVCTVLLAAAVAAQEARIFRIGTGPIDSSQYAVGGLIGNAVSAPPGSRDCERGGSCGVPGLVVVGQSSEGALANVTAIGAGQLESALVQADIAYWAYHGTGLYRRQGSVGELRAIANLYSEVVHVVVRAESGITEFRQLRGKAVSLGERNSATLITARTLLEAQGLAERDLKPQFLALGAAAEALREGKIDAFIALAAAPDPVIRDLAEDAAIALVPIAGNQAARLKAAFPFLTATEVPGGSYRDIAAAASVSVGTLWLVAASVPDETVYGLVRGLFHPNARKALEAGPAFARAIRPDTALEGVALPLHPGAALYYFESGLIK